MISLGTIEVINDFARKANLMSQQTKSSIKALLINIRAVIRFIWFTYSIQTRLQLTPAIIQRRETETNIVSQKVTFKTRLKLFNI
jgi:hypothetical protein